MRREQISCRYTYKNKYARVCGMNNSLREDVTRQKRAERELAHQRKLANAVRKMKRHFREIHTYVCVGFIAERRGYLGIPSYYKNRTCDYIALVARRRGYNRGFFSLRVLLFKAKPFFHPRRNQPSSARHGPSHNARNGYS